MGMALGSVTTCIVLNVVLHLLVLRLLWRHVWPRWKPSNGIGIAVLVLGCIVGHILEIIIFTAGIAVTALMDGETKLALSGYRSEQLDLWYYSAAFYTSLGADRPPNAGLRVFAACEALTGLILITWTASFLFLLMQSSWTEVTVLGGTDRKDEPAPKPDAKS